MDPDAVLAKMLAAQADVMLHLDGMNTDGDRTLHEAAWALAESVENMNDWLANGGFLPLAWALGGRPK